MTSRGKLKRLRGGRISLLLRFSAPKAGLGLFGSPLERPQLGALDGQANPLIGELAEGLECGHQGGDLLKRTRTNEAAGKIAVIDVG